MGHFARECRAPRNKEGQFKNQDNTRKQGNNEDTYSKTMLAIDGVGFDWSDMAKEQVQTNISYNGVLDYEEIQDLLKWMLMALDWEHRLISQISRNLMRLCYIWGGAHGDLLKFLEKAIEKGIKREYSVTKTPQQNGMAERRNRTLIEAARTMLADSKLPTTFWAEAVSTACYVQNRVLVVKPHNKTPYELFRGFKPALSFMRPFGCHVTILNTLDNLGKFDGKSDEVAAGTISNESAGTQEELNAGTSTQKEEISQDCIVMPICKDATYFDSPFKDVGLCEPKLLLMDPKANSSKRYVQIWKLSIHLRPLMLSFFCDDDETEIEPTSIAQALSDSSWVEAMQKELLLFMLHNRVLETCGFAMGDGPLEVVKGSLWVHQGLHEHVYRILGANYSVVANGFKRGKIDQTLFIKKKKGDILLVQVYVDDIIFGSTNKELYVKSASTLVDLENPLVKDGDADDVDVHLY
ncbi:ribonuclease H-like domain-containing protein [Tanacetum coccineum]